MKAIKHESHLWGYSVLVDTEQGFNVWMDVCVGDGVITDTDWNQYIFYTNDSDDVKRMKFQDDIENFNAVDCAATDYLYINKLI